MTIDNQMYEPESEVGNGSESRNYTTTTINSMPSSHPLTAMANAAQIRSIDDIPTSKNYRHYGINE